MRIHLANLVRQDNDHKEISLSIYLNSSLPRSPKLEKAESSVIQDLVNKLFTKRHLGSASSGQLHHFIKKIDGSNSITLNPTNKPNEFTIHYSNPCEIFDLIKRGSIEGVKSLIEEKKIDVNSTDENGNSLLSLTVIHNQLEIFRYLISIPKVDLNLTGKDGWSPLYYAVVLKDKTMLNTLVELGAKLNLKNKDGSTALHRAVDNNDLKAVEILIQHKADPNKLNCHGTPLLAAARKGFTQIAQFLLQNGADVNKATDPMGTTPLAMAMNNGHEDMIQLLNGAGGRKKPDLPKGSTSALSFKEGTHIEPLKDNVNLKDQYGRTVAHLWAYTGDFELGLKLLQLQRVDFDIADCFGRTPLHYAVMGGHLTVVDSLLSKKVNVNAQDKQGYFPLHWTAQYKNRKKIAKHLIRGNADVTMKDYFGWTAFRKAAEHNNIEMGKLLLKTRLVDVNEKTPDGKTALHRAAINGSLEFAQFLILNGADCHVLDNAGKRPQDYAGQNERMTALFST